MWPDLAGVSGADPPGSLGDCGVFEGLLQLGLSLGVTLHEVYILLVLAGLGTLARPPLLGEAHIPTRVLGRHQGRVVVFQNLLNEHALLASTIRLPHELAFSVHTQVEFCLLALDPDLTPEGICLH